MRKRVLGEYKFVSEGLPIAVSIYRDQEHFAPFYNIKLPEFEKATLAFLENVKNQILTIVPIKLEVFRNPEQLERVKNTIKARAATLIKELSLIHI